MLRKNFLTTNRQRSSVAETPIDDDAPIIDGEVKNRFGYYNGVGRYRIKTDPQSLTKEELPVDDYYGKNSVFPQSRAPRKIRVPSVNKENKENEEDKENEGIFYLEALLNRSYFITLFQYDHYKGEGYKRPIDR